MCSADRTRPQATPTSREDGGRLVVGTRGLRVPSPQDPGARLRVASELGCCVGAGRCSTPFFHTRGCTCASPSTASSSSSRDDQRRRSRAGPPRPASTDALLQLCTVLGSAWKRCTATVTAQPVTSSWSTIRWRWRGVNLAFECWVGMGSDQSDTSTSRRQSRLDQNQNLVPKRSRMPPRHDDLLVVNVPEC